MKFCIHCRHYVPPSCPENLDDGCRLSNLGAYVMRSPEGKCSPAAFLYEKTDP